MQPGTAMVRRSTARVPKAGPAAVRAGLRLAAFSARKRDMKWFCLAAQRLWQSLEMSSTTHRANMLRSVGLVLA